MSVSTRLKLILHNVEDWIHTIEYLISLWIHSQYGKKEGTKNRVTLSLLIVVLFLAGGHVKGQHDSWARFAVITYDSDSGQFVFYAIRWNYVISSYICQLQQQGLTTNVCLSMSLCGSKLVSK